VYNQPSVECRVQKFEIRNIVRGVCVLQNPKCQLYHSFITSISKPTHVVFVCFRILSVNCITHSSPPYRNRYTWCLCASES
jgi:hypothetical protein